MVEASFCPTQPLNQQIVTSLRPVLTNSEHITLDHNTLVQFSSTLNRPIFEDMQRDNRFDRLIKTYMPHQRDAIDLLGVFNSINFCYWAQDPTTKWKYFSQLTQQEEDGAYAEIATTIHLRSAGAAR